MTISIEIYPGKGLSVQLSVPADAPAILLAKSLDTRLSHVCGHSSSLFQYRLVLGSLPAN
jgi:hypothetical protein